MKTAGTSFRQNVESKLGPRIYPTQAEVRQNSSNRYLPASELISRIEAGQIDLEDKIIVMGHYAAAIAKALPGNRNTATFLRNPIDRSISMIAQRKKRLPWARMSVDEVLHSKFINRFITNYQTKVFSIDEPSSQVNIPFTVDEDAFSRALSRLDQLDFVGITEEYGKSLGLFTSMSGISFNGEVYQANKSRREELTTNQLRRIERLVELDMELYEVARKRFEKQCSERLCS
jgi:hypothetical protein